MKFRETAPKILGDSNRQTSGSQESDSKWRGCVCVAVSCGCMSCLCCVDDVARPDLLQARATGSRIVVPLAQSSFAMLLNHTTSVPTFFSKFFSTCAKSRTLQSFPRCGSFQATSVTDGAAEPETLYA
jgi:hypothetical protein